MSTIQTTNYAEFLSLCKTGDTIATCNKTIIAKFIQLTSRDERSHTGIVLILDGIPFLAEMDGIKDVLISLQQHADTKCYLYNSPIQTDETTFKEALLTMLGTVIKYSWDDILKLLSNRLFGFPRIPKVSKGTMVCTEFCSVFYKRLGWSGYGAENTLYPVDVCKALGEPIAIYTPPKLAK